MTDAEKMKKAKEIVSNGTCSGVCSCDAEICPAYSGMFDCERYSNGVEAAQAFIDYHTPTSEVCNRKYHFEKNITYSLNGEEFSPSELIQEIETKTKTRDALTCEVNKLKYIKKSFDKLKDSL